MFTAQMNEALATRRRLFRTRSPRGALVAMLVAAGVGVSLDARASPALEGTRNLGLSGGRASASGSNAALINISAMNDQRQFTVEPIYQYAVRQNQHGLGIVAMDSLLNPRFGIALGYVFMRGQPKVSFLDAETGEEHSLELSSFGHEVFLGISVSLAKNLIVFGLKPKYQYNSLRYRDAEGNAVDAHQKLNTFGLDTAITFNAFGWAAVSVGGDNLVGSYVPPYTSERELNLLSTTAEPGTINPGTLSPISGYPLSLTHGLAVYPLRRPIFSLNFDGTYDFTTYKHDNYTRLTMGGSAEFIAGPVPIRFGTLWDGRGRGSDDDVVFVSGGVGFLRPAKTGSLGVDAGFSFRQQVSGAGKETLIGLNIGIRIHPDL